MNNKRKRQKQVFFTYMKPKLDRIAISGLSDVEACKQFTCSSTPLENWDDRLYDTEERKGFVLREKFEKEILDEYDIEFESDPDDKVVFLKELQRRFYDAVFCLTVRRSQTAVPVVLGVFQAGEKIPKTLKNASLYVRLEFDWKHILKK